MPPLIWVTWFCLPLSSQCTFELYLLLFWISMSLAVFLLFVWFCGCFHSSILPALRLLTSSTEAVTAHIALWFPAPCRRQSLLAHTYSFWFFLRYANLRVCLNLYSVRCLFNILNSPYSLLKRKKVAANYKQEFFRIVPKSMDCALIYCAWTVYPHLWWVAGLSWD